MDRKQQSFSFRILFPLRILLLFDIRKKKKKKKDEHGNKLEEERRRELRTRNRYWYFLYLKKSKRKITNKKKEEKSYEYNYLGNLMESRIVLVDKFKKTLTDILKLIHRKTY